MPSLKPTSPEKPKKSRKWYWFVLIVFAILALIFFWGFALKKPKGFDADRIAAAETHMWQAYYSKDYKTLGIELVTLLRNQFQLSYMEAALVAEDLVRATMIFQPSDRDYERALPNLTSAYAKIRDEVGGTWDPAEAAKAELDWWTARRSKDSSSVEEVGRRIARLYTILYGKSNADIEQAGYLRAQAAALRDSGGAGADWPRIEQLLQESYRTLVKGISGGANDSHNRG